jgi:hypothetical protein
MLSPFLPAVPCVVGDSGRVTNKSEVYALADFGRDGAAADFAVVAAGGAAAWTLAPYPF